MFSPRTKNERILSFFLYSLMEQACCTQKKRNLLGKLKAIFRKITCFGLCRDAKQPLLCLGCAGARGVFRSRSGPHPWERGPASQCLFSSPLPLGWPLHPPFLEGGPDRPRQGDTLASRQKVIFFPFLRFAQLFGGHF